MRALSQRLLALILLILTVLSVQGSPAPHAVGRLQPVGEAKGIFPGRVAWAHSPGAATAPAGAPDWFADRYVSRDACRELVATTLSSLTGETDPEQAWEALFMAVNGNTRGFLKGETVAIKIDNSNTTSHYNSPQINVTPQVVAAVVRSLVQAGVPADAIAIVEPGAYITDGVYEAVRQEAPGAVFVDRVGGDGRLKANFKGVRRSRFSSQEGGPARAVEQTLAEASYIINLAVLKGIGADGVKLCGRNWVSAFEPVRYGREDHLDRAFRPESGWSPMADLVTNSSLGGKCVLYLIDALMGSPTPGGKPSHRWSGEPFGTDVWPCSLLGSIDPVAIDMVGIDLLETQFTLAANSDRYLRQGATNGLGVAEHWASPAQRLYSRNLGRPRGIELAYTLR